jgi:cytochrome c-type biogenesis protein CcmH/NrfF
MSWLRRLSVVLIVLCSCAPLALAVDVDKARYEKLGGKMQCTCSCSQPLLKCNHVGCTRSEEMIHDLKASLNIAKNTDTNVLDWFRHNYGITAVVEPGTEGFELLAWVVPPALLLAAIVLLVILVRKWRLNALRLAVAEGVTDVQFDAQRARARQETEL